MPSQYDDYRMNPQGQANPWALGAGPQQFYAPSSSLWGGMRGPAFQSIGRGYLALSAQGGRNNAERGAMAFAGLQGAIGNQLVRSFGGMNELQDGSLLKNLGNASNWQNFATFGRSGAKRAQGQAENDRAVAVANWRNQASKQFGDVLGQQGADVRGDLQGELDAALGVGQRGMDMNATQDAMTQFQQRYQQYMLGRQQAGQARQVDAMFADPARAAQQTQRLDAEKRQGLGQLAEQYRIGQRNNAINQARRGTQGGSMDVEQQGDLNRQRDAGAAGLQSGLEARAQQYRLGDAQQKNTLMGMIYADDPNMAAMFQNTLQGIGQQGAMVRENQAIGQQMNQQRQAAQTGYSQAVGGLLSSASLPLGYYVEHRGGGA